MGRTDNPTIWEKIQRNVQETERLIGQKKYNLAMIKARQTMEYMVKLHCDKAGIVESTPDTMIRELYSGKWISKSTAEHYLQILSIGEQAAKEGDNGAFNANQAYHILSQEVYVFSDSDKPERPRKSTRDAGNTKAAASGRAGGSSRAGSSRSGPQSRSRRRQKRSGLNSTDLLKLLIPVVLVIVLIFLIRVLTPDNTPTEETTTAPTTTEMPTTMAPTEPESTEEETEAVTTYRTTDVLNVRSGPSTDDERIGKLDAGVTVEVVSDYDDTWAVILYNGQEAYISKDYLELQDAAE